MGNYYAQSEGAHYFAVSRVILRGKLDVLFLLSLMYWLYAEEVQPPNFLSSQSWNPADAAVDAAPALSE